ncbi:MAG TPA: glutaredoxin family protein [Planctomycetota bacterium]|nr:glutaredoxin family protein [Planctomycetota bacterium]
MNDDIAFLSGHDLAVYSTSWCPDCTRLKRWLAASGVATHEVNIDEVEGAAAKLEQETGKRAIPFVLVDGKQWVRGYHKESRGRFDPALFLAELRQAIAAGSMQ